MTTHFTGSKYNSKTDIADVAKAFKQDVKTGIAKKTIPAGLKLSVRISRYSMGQSIEVRIVELPEGVCVPYTTEFLTWWRAEEANYFNGKGFGGGARLTPEMTALVEKLEAMLNEYNFDKSDSQSDYYHQKFFLNVALDAKVGNVKPYLALL